VIQKERLRVIELLRALARVARALEAHVCPDGGLRPRRRAGRCGRYPPPSWTLARAHDFAQKLAKAGFVDLVTVGERTYGIDDCEIYAPLFTPEFIEVLRRVVRRRGALRLRSLVFVGRKPG
jgi:hypothetical protein